jgi:hypothetical protein
MTKYMFVYHHPVQSPEEAAAAAAKFSPEEMQKVMKAWQDWIAEGMEKGWMLNRGNGLTQECRVVDPKKVVTDGPFMETKEIVGGFSIVEAENIDAAAELAKGCPTLHSGGHVEVRALWDQKQSWK